MEFTPFRIVVFAIAVLCLIYLFMFLKNLPQEDALNILEKQVDLAQTDLGRENFVENVQFKSGQSFSGETFDLQTRSVSFNCNNIERCCEKGIKCNKTIEWTERNVSIKDSTPIKTSARCDMQYGLFACRIYFGTKPAQLEIANAEIQKQIDLKQSDSVQLAVELGNSGELPSFLAKMNAKLYQREFKNEIEEKKFIEEKSAEIESVLPNKTSRQTIEFNVPSDGNYFIELKAYADESGFDGKKVYFNAIDSTASACSADQADEEIVWDSESKNCKQKYYCKNCTYSFECKDLWEKQLNIDLNSWDKTYAYLTLPCDNPESSQLSPEEQGLLTNGGKTLNVDNKTIVLDPGHGPSSKSTGSGCSSSRPYVKGITEPEISMDIAIRVKQLLEAKNVKVLLSRNSNENPGCSTRSNVANNSNADLFLSIHENAGGGTGTESYYYNGGANSSNNKKLASSIQQELVKSTGLKNRGVKLDTQSQYKTGLGVLRNSKMPAMLVETAFIDGDNAKLHNNEFKQKIAQGIYNGIVAYYGGNFSIGGTGGGTTVSGNSCQKNVVEIASKQVGKRYVFGTEGPNTFDCSGLTWYAYKTAGFGSVYGGRITAHIGARTQGKVVDGNPASGKAVAPNFSKLQPGDIVYFGTYKKTSHTGIYIGNGKIIEAANPRRGVIISKLGLSSGAPYNGARRVC